jgi:hypothetical protein
MQSLRHFAQRLLLFTCLVAPATSDTTWAHDFSSKAALTPPLRAVSRQVSSLDADVPSGGRAVRGVLNKFKIWPAGQTIYVCFRDGSALLKRAFVETADRWREGTSLTVDYGPAPDYRLCARATQLDIAVSFTDSGYWSYIGTDSRPLARTKATLNVEADDTVFQSPSSRLAFDRLVLHEFGHALGLEHEHQSPAAQCDAEFDWPKLKALTDSYGWPPGDLEHNMKGIVASPRLIVTPYDKSSIMHYYFPSDYFVKGEASACFAKENSTLSATDRELIRRFYPPLKPADDKAASYQQQMQRQADDASLALASLALTPPELTRFATELRAILDRNRTKISLRFRLTEADSAAPASGGPATRTVSPDAPRARGIGSSASTLSCGTSCTVQADFSAFTVSAGWE